MAAKQDPAETGLDIIEAGYRLVADASAFEDLIASWADRLDRVDSKQIARLNHPLLVRHMSAVGKLFDAAEPEGHERFEMATIGVDGPAAVLTMDCRVVAANPQAGERWNLQLGMPTQLDWLDKNSRDSFDAVRRSASTPGSGRHAILRTNDLAGAACLAECYIIEPGDDGPGCVAVRALELGWNDDIAATLSRTFDLTDAEVEICRLLLDTRDTALMAKLRRTSVHTVRTQLRTIFSKTGTATQVDLIRLVAMLCARSRANMLSSKSGWTDPLGREQSFTDDDGNNIAFSWLGDPDGTPALLVHGMATGYLLPSACVKALCDNNIKLYAISRPGFGNSSAIENPDPQEDAAKAIVALAAHLGIASWAAIGLSAGMAPLIRAARDGRAGLNSILGVASYLPFPKNERFEGFPLVRKIAFRLVRSSRHMADLTGQFTYRMIKSRKSAFIQDYMYSDCAADRGALQRPECSEQIHTAHEFLIAQGHRAISNDMSMMASHWSADLEECRVPIKLFHGTADPVVSIEHVRMTAARYPAITLTEFPDGGELLWRDRGAEMIQALAGMVQNQA